MTSGCLGLFEGHLDPGEMMEQALWRELLEEITSKPLHLNYQIERRTPRRTAHFSRG
jgi:hypothetical protein